MKEISKKINLVWKDSGSMWYAMNSKAITDTNRPLGITEGSFKHFVSNGEECAILYPSIVKTSSVNNPKWQEKFNYWLNSITVYIMDSGRMLEVGFKYDINDISKKEYVDAINADIKERFKDNADKRVLNSDERLEAHYNRLRKAIDEELSKNLMEAESTYKRSNRKVFDEMIGNAHQTQYDKLIKLESMHYKIGTPINTEDYFFWRLCLVHSEVANSRVFEHAAPKIRFVLEDVAEQRRVIKEQSLQEDKAMAIYLKVIEDTSLVNNILYVFDKTPTEGVSKKDVLKNLYKTETKRFIEVAEDKKLALKAEISLAIANQFLTTVPLTGEILLTEDQSISLGKSLDEAAQSLSSDDPKSKEIYNKIKFKLKSLQSV